MADNTKYGNAADFDVDLHSIFAAYLGLFESTGLEWWEKSWGGYFTSFGDFLGFSWEVMVVVDGETGRAHIAVRRDQIGLFAKMIRTRFGESLPKDPPTTLPLRPVVHQSLRRLVSITDLAAYRKLAATLPAAELAHLRTRVGTGEVDVADQLFYAGDNERRHAGVRDNGVGYTWACISTTWWERGSPPSGFIPGSGFTKARSKGLVLEVGMAVVRCAHLRAVSVWPPVPQENYRKSHFIVEEWVDKRTNASPPSYPRAYAFGSSRFVAEKNIERIVDATVGALASQENDSQPNTLVLLTAGPPLPLPVPISSTLPNNILYLDVLALEHRLLRRHDPRARSHPLPSLAALLQTLQIPVPHFAPLGNAGNDAFYTVLAFQKLLMAETRLPDVLFGHPSVQSWTPPVPPYARPAHSRHGSSERAAPSAYSYSPRRTSGTSWTGLPTYEQPSTPPDTRRHPHPDSAPSTVRQTTTRAQTVFWDDSDYATKSPSSAQPGNTGSSSRGRPPSAIRDQSVLLLSSSSRSVSWGAMDSPLDPPDRSSWNRRGAPSPARDSEGKAVSNGSASRNGSSTKLSSDSKSSEMVQTPKNPSSNPNPNPNAGTQTASTGQPPVKPKMKSEKSMKNLAGSLAKFWVG